jgi:hypothetical protein
MQVEHFNRQKAAPSLGREPLICCILCKFTTAEAAPAQGGAPFPDAAVPLDWAPSLDGPHVQIHSLDGVPFPEAGWTPDEERFLDEVGSLDEEHSPVAPHSRGGACFADGVGSPFGAYSAVQTPWADAVLRGELRD